MVFVNGETEDQARRAELWFESALSCTPSPSVPRIKARRSFKVETMYNFNEEEEEEKSLKDKEPSEPIPATISSQPEPNRISEAKKEEVTPTEARVIKLFHSNSKDTDASNLRDATTDQTDNKENVPPAANTEACTLKPLKRGPFWLKFSLNVYQWRCQVVNDGCPSQLLQRRF